MTDYRVNLDIFAGPLDLLLYLVRRDEVDIYDISISKITEEYLKYIEILKNLDLELAGEFLIMAAALMEIKSAMLLPKSEFDQEADDIEADDPKNELIRQLLEYKKFKDAANLLNSSAAEQDKRFSRPNVIIEKIAPDTEEEVEIEQISVWDLLNAFDGILKATGNYRDYSSIKDDTPIDLYQIEILHKLQQDGPVSFENIFKGKKNKMVMVGMFLAILELIRQKLIWAQQDDDNSVYVKALTDEAAEDAVRKTIAANLEEPSEELTSPDSQTIEEPSEENHKNQEVRDSSNEHKKQPLPIPIVEIKNKNSSGAVKQPQQSSKL